MNADRYGKVNPYVKDLLSTLFTTVAALQDSIAETEELSTTVTMLSTTVEALQDSVAEQEGGVNYTKKALSAFAVLRDPTAAQKGEAKALLAALAALQDSPAEENDNDAKVGLRNMESLDRVSLIRSKILGSESFDNTQSQGPSAVFQASNNRSTNRNEEALALSDVWKEEESIKSNKEPTSWQDVYEVEDRYNHNDDSVSKANEGNSALNSVALHDKKYPQDCYSFLSIHGPGGKRTNKFFFLFGLLPFVFQVIFLILLLWSGTDELRGTVGDNDNPTSERDGFLAIVASFIPADVSPIVRCTQVIAIAAYLIFPDSSMKDVVRAVQHFPRPSQVQPGDAVGCIRLSCLLRGAQGILAIFAVLLLVIRSDNVVDIILNFTAVNFISNLDDAAFSLAMSGEFGPMLKTEAGRISNEDLPPCMYKTSKHVYYRIVVGIISVIFSGILIFLIVAQESNYIWKTRIVRVELQEETGLKEYSGCYEINDKSSFFQRHTYNSFGKDINTTSSFGYCRDERAWILFKDDKDNFDPCDAIDNNGELARSSKTDAFDISTSFDELWVSSSNTPLDLYFFDGQNETDIQEHCDSLLGDGICDQYLNKLGYDFDGGDCCAATCSQSNCGRGGLTRSFGSTLNYTGIAFPDCDDPKMVSILIHLNEISSSRNTKFSFIEDSRFEKLGINQTEWRSENPLNPYFSLDCNGRNVLTIYIQERMVSNSETVMVEDGASCKLVVRNTTTNIDFATDAPIWFVNYTLFHLDESKTFEILTRNSGDEEIANFVRIPQCYFRKLENHVDTASIYTASGPLNDAIDWLLNDQTGNSQCEDENFIERYALVNMNYALSGNETFINEDNQCTWPLIQCSNEGQAKTIKLQGKDLKGDIPSEIALLQSLEEIHLGELRNMIHFAISALSHGLGGRVDKVTLTWETFHSK
jgi:hypothetical protein